MARLARGRDTHLTPPEIAREALRQFDAGGSPSIRNLATALGVAPAAIYYHYPSHAAIVDAVVHLVWQEAAVEGLTLLADPFSSEPAEVLVVAGLATRRAFTRHYRVAPNLAATPTAHAVLVANLSLLADAFERLGLSGRAAGVAFHAFGSYVIGSVLFVAARRRAAESFDVGAEPLPVEPGPDGGSSEETRQQLHAMLDLSFTDPERDEELFVLGLRRLVGSFQTAAT